VKRGDVFWADLHPRSGAEQRGRRPVIVLSNDGFNLTPSWRSVIVVPVSTSGTQARRGPTAVALASGSGGLPRAGVAVCHQVTTLDRAKLTEHLGTLPGAALAAIEGGLRAALDLD
jgi:mRNA-degrading endonuclease toxin of MazEF toxin-antitoxin module